MIQFLLILYSNKICPQNLSDIDSTATIGFVDKNKDGTNDLFHDSNGDGINDVTQKPYSHNFKFEDKDDNKINDLWIDDDGDGVNDLMNTLLKQRQSNTKSSWIDMDGDGIQDGDGNKLDGVNLKKFVVDMNNDGKNDITGIEYNEDFVFGYRFGVIDEERGKKLSKFIDDNKDGMHDRYAKRLLNETKRIQYGQKSKRYFDYFIDKDGDGICDERGNQGLGSGGARKRHGSKDRK